MLGAFEYFAVSLSMSDRIKLTSGLWRAAVLQLELEVICAKALALQVLQQLNERGTKRLSAVQAKPVAGHLNLEVLILTHRTRLIQVDLEA